MTSLVFLVEQTAPGLYIFLAIALVVTWRRWVNARRAYRSTHFELEREVTRYRLGGTFTSLVLLAEAGMIVFGMQQIVAPTIRDDREIMGTVEEMAPEIFDDGNFVTPTRPPPASGPVVDASGFEFDDGQEVQIFQTPVPTATPVGTIEPNYPEVSGCDTPNAFLQIPANGMVVFQPIRVVGSAFVENFSSWKVELKGSGTFDQFAVIDEGTVPQTEIGTLTQFNPAWEPGLYEFRLMVFDTTTALKASCRITIRISEPIPTPTPLGE
jgi:hypothetical protein